MIQIRNIKKSFGEHTVIDGFSLDIERGSAVAIMGESGSGKTTLLRIIAFLDMPNAGELLGYADNEIAYVFQESRLFEWLTVLDNVALVADSCVSDAKKKAAAILERMGLGEALSLHPSALSGGMKQRVNLARALVSGRSILLLDEPFSALDKDTRLVMLRLVKELTSDKTVILVTHQHEDATTLCDKVVCLTTASDH